MVLNVRERSKAEKPKKGVQGRGYNFKQSGGEGLTGKETFE